MNSDFGGGAPIELEFLFGQSSLNPAGEAVLFGVMKMNFQEAIKTCFAKYATFSGRAPRSEYWYFFLLCALVYALAAVLDDATATQHRGSNNLFTGIAILALLSPTISVSVRRMHDSDISGLWLLAFFGANVVGAGVTNALGFQAGAVLALLSWCLLVAIMLLPGTNGSNKYGVQVTALSRNGVDVDPKYQELDLIEKLYSLRQKGALSEEEFQAHKARLLGHG